VLVHLVELVEDKDAAASIEARRFEEPHIAPVEATRTQGVSTETSSMHLLVDSINFDLVELVIYVLHRVGFRRACKDVEDSLKCLDLTRVRPS
jgi:hypothetical protein